MVCTYWLKCACECHEQISLMFAMVEEPRLPQQNPEYSPWVNTWFIPDPRDWQATVAEQTQGVVQVSDHEDTPSLVIREFEETPTGRSPRGQLEQNVLQACNTWVKEGSQGECTTKWVSEWISDQWGELPPSRGAIDAVWKRWVSLGFALTLSHPTQFVCYTPDGLKQGLEGMKAHAKHADKKKLTAQKLGRR